ncbi:MAG TPA: helix-turn-helix transcriptional regulator [Bradyrhizobium sp.]|nr:helix-turn-helix transcriptional regulator [Bradyrhizobium sp.]
MADSNTFTDKIISPDIVRSLRETLGMTQAELANEAKVSEDKVKAYEAGAPTKIRGCSRNRFGVGAAWR